MVNFARLVNAACQIAHFVRHSVNVVSQIFNVACQNVNFDRWIVKLTRQIITFCSQIVYLIVRLNIDFVLQIVNVARQT